VVRGGSLLTNTEEHAMLIFRDTRWPPGTRDYWLGFRCVSDTPPPK
jgi:hypothetical protein